MNEKTVIISVEIISNVGSAKSSFIEAIEIAKNGDISSARDHVKEGTQFLVEGHKAHAQLLTMEANGEGLEFGLLLMHAEDQLMSAETIQVMSESFIDLYEELHSPEV